MSESDQFESFCRKSSADLDLLLNLVGLKLKKNNLITETKTGKQLLAVTLRFVASGCLYTSFMYIFTMP
jgi:hypothetical protein